ATLVQRLDANRQNALQIARVDGRVRPNRPHGVVPKGGKELLGHRTVVTELARIVTNVVPACHVQAADFSEHIFAINPLEILFLGRVGSEGVRHLAFDDRDRSIAQPDFVAVIDDGAVSNGRGVVQIARSYIGANTDGGVVAAGAVA